MKEPILEPGRPGDLKMILRIGLEHLDELERSKKDPNDEAWGIAVTMLRALCAWMGFGIVPEVERPH